MHSWLNCVVIRYKFIVILQSAFPFPAQPIDRTWDCCLWIVELGSRVGGGGVDRGLKNTVYVLSPNWHNLMNHLFFQIVRQIRHSAPWHLLSLVLTVGGLLCSSVGHFKKDVRTIIGGVIYIFSGMVSGWFRLSSYAVLCTVNRGKLGLEIQRFERSHLSFPVYALWVGAPFSPIVREKKGHPHCGSHRVDIEKLTYQNQFV